MKNKLVRNIAVLALPLVLIVGLTGCTKHATKTKKSESGTTDISLTQENYVLILSNETSAYDDLVVQGFTETMETANRAYKIERPKGGTVADQQKAVKSAIRKEASTIAIAPNDAEAMEDTLKEAMENGIDVCSFGLAASPDSRELTISNLGSDAIATTLMDAVLDIAGGEGQWAILSASSVSTSHNLWIDKMKETMKDEKYENLQLLEIAYGDGQFKNSYEQTKALLQNYPDLKVICSPVTEGMEAAAQAIQDSGSNVRITGFGLPSEMKDFVGDDRICPYFYLWNPVDLGSLTAYVSIALHEDQITGELGEKFKAGALGEYEVTKADDDGTEVILSAPYRFDAGNIDKWSETL